MAHPARNAETKCAELKMASVKLIESDMDEEELEGSMEADTGELSRNNTYLKQIGCVRSLVQKVGRFNGKKLDVDVDESSDNHLDDIREACSGIGEGQRFGVVRYEILKKKNGPTKRSKKVLFLRGMDIM